MNSELLDYVLPGSGLAAFVGAIVYARLNTRERRYRRYERREDAKAGKTRKTRS